MGIFSNYVNFNNQSYKDNLNECQRDKVLFTDPTFPPNNESLSPDGLIKDLADVIWKRPCEICSNPKLVCDSQSYVCQGEVPNYNILSCLAIIGYRNDCFKKIIPNYVDQELNIQKPDKYAGIFVFNFWRYGEWIEVVIDDHLPTRNGKLISIHSPLENEFWSALLEKAYAKIVGSYESLIKCSEEEVLVDFTGGLPEQIFDLSANIELDKFLEVFDLLKKAYEDEALICGSIEYNEGIGDRLPCGLMTKYCYNITGVKEMNIKNSSLVTSFNKDKLMMIRLCHPSWDKKWNGAFAEGGKEWQLLTSSEKSKMGQTYSNDGEFWILFQDFVKTFNRLLILRIPNTNILSLKSTWYEGKGNEFWYGYAKDNDKAIEGSGGGGQFYFEINRPTGDTVLINILQKCRKGSELPMAFLLLKVERNRQTVLFSTKFAQLIEQYHIDNTRSIGLRYVLKPGSYIIKCYLKSPPGKGDQIFYHIRIYTTAVNNCKFLISDSFRKYTVLCPCFETEACVITRLRVVRASSLSKNISKGYHNAYCEIECEGETYYTSVCKDSAAPEWEEAFLLYRIKPEKPIIIRIFNKCSMIDDFLGLVEYHFDTSSLNKEPVLIKSPLKMKDPKKTGNMPGTLEVAFWHTDSYVNL